MRRRTRGTGEDPDADTALEAELMQNSGVIYTKQRLTVVVRQAGVKTEKSVRILNQIQKAISKQNQKKDPKTLENKRKTTT